MVGRRQRGEEGVALIDLVVGCTIFLLVFLALAYVIEQSDIANATARERTDASIVANNVLSEFLARNCVLESGISFRHTTTCTKLEDQSEKFDGYTFSYTLSVTWVASLSVAERISACPTGGSYVEPAGAFASAVVAWTPGAAKVQQTFPYDATLSTFEATPVGEAFSNNSYGGVVVFGMRPGSAITLATTQGAEQIQSIANPSYDCVWFPFVPAGTYEATYCSQANSSMCTTLSTQVTVVADADSSLLVSSTDASQTSCPTVSTYTKWWHWPCSG